MGAKNPIPFGKYYLLDRVNVGGMAEVWRSKTFGAEGFEKITAIKRILPNIAEDEEFIRMFIDEAKISVSLTHANISQVFDLGKIADSYFIAMEYVSGKDLRAIFDRCRKKGEPAPIPMTCYIMGKVCEGLDYAHRKKEHTGRDMNIVHRDVSPANVLVSFEGEIKVIDFGIAKAANKATKTQAGILKGKFGYMSPEQVRGLPLDRRSDVFALGVVLYEMLAGERLFVGETDFSVLEKVRQVDILPPSHYNRRIPEALEKIVYRALAKEPEDRYQYASDLADDLQKFLIAGDTVFGRKDLMQYMKSTFAEDFEREKVRLAEYAEVKLPATMALAAGLSGRGDDMPPTNPSMNRAASLGNLKAANPAQARRPSMPVPVLSASPPPSEDQGDEFAEPGEEGAAKTNLLNQATMSPVAPSQRRSSPQSPLLTDEDFGQGMDTADTLPPKGAERRASGSRIPAADRGNGEGVYVISRPSGPVRESMSMRSGAHPIPEEEAPEEEFTAAPARPQRSRAVLVVAFLAVLLAAGAVGWVVLQKSAAKLILLVEPRDAKVLVDGKAVASHKEIQVSSGEHQVEARADGFEPFTKRVTATAGDDAQVVDIQLKRVNEVGTLVVVPTPVDAEVEVDNKVVKPVGSSNPATVDLPADDEHVVLVRKPGYGPKTLRARVQSGKPTVLPVTLEAQQGDLRVSTDPPGADIVVDGRKYPEKTPASIRGLDLTRDHSIQVSRRCYQTVAVPFTAGSSPELPQVRLSKLPGCH